MLALARLPFARLMRSPRAWLPVLAWSALAIVAAVYKRVDHAPHGADLVMLGAFGSVSLPLVAYAIVGGALGGEGLGRSGRSLVAFGATPASVALATALVAVAATAILGAVMGAGLAALAHASDDPPLVRDVLACAWISALAGACYAAIFVLGAAIGARGTGRGVLLAVDWIVGSGTSFGAALLPRAHARNLYGGEGPLALGQRGSTLALVVIGAAALALAVLLARLTRRGS
jgi:hypothetical protein